MVGTLRNISCPSLIVLCVEDHMHSLLQLSRTVTIASEVESMKVESSTWFKKQDPSLRSFYWQTGYSAFSVSQSNVDRVKRYIAGHEQHHRRRSFQDELRALLARHEIEFDERYVWD